MARELPYDGKCRRFDLYGALWLFCTRYHSGRWSRGYRILSRLALLGYRPGLTIREGHGFENEEQRDIYRALWRSYRKVV